MIPCDPEYGHLSVLRHRHRLIADLFSALHLLLVQMLQFSDHEQYFGQVVSNFKCSEHFYIRMSMVWLQCRYRLLSSFRNES